MSRCQDGTLISFVRAAKELGMTLVPIKIDEDFQDENSKLRALISNNFGRRKNDPAKDRKALATYVELKGYKNGENQWGCQNGAPKSFLDDIAKEPEKSANLACFSLDEIAKEIGINMVPLRIREDLIDEDKKLKVLLAANFQRPKNSDAKQRKVADEYVRLCGYKPGNNQRSDQNGLTLDEIAKQLGTSKTNLKRALRIERNLTDSMKELLDTGGAFLDISLVK